MSYPEKVIVVVTCHGSIEVNKSNNQPKLFRIPDKMKIVKMSAVTPGICNLTIDEDVDKFIKMILDKKHKKEMKKGLKSPETYAKSLGNLYKLIEDETVKGIYTASPDSNTEIRNTYIHHRDKSYEIITYNRKHPYMINKEYSRNNKNEQNSSAWDFGIFCLNVEGKPDLITELKGRSYTDKNTYVYLEEIISYLRGKGVKEVVLLDLSCSVFEYEQDENDENNKETTVSERNTRSIRSNLIKQRLNGGSSRKKRTTKKRGLFGKRKNKNNQSTITRKRKLLKKFRGAGKKEDIQKILELYNIRDTPKKLLTFKLLKDLPEETIRDLITKNQENPNYLDEWIHVGKFGSIFYGKMQNGVMNGEGKLVNITGDIYEGEFRNNQLYRGKLIYQDGPVLQGEFKNNQLNGKGRATNNEGDIYEGEFNNGELVEGKMIYKNGTYEGKFKNNKLIEGTVTLNNGDMIEGDWKDGILIDPRKIIYANGDIYEGKFKIDYKIDNNNKTKLFFVRYGVGKMKYADGSIYEGSYKDNKRDGLGKFTDPSTGTVYEGQWKNGQRYGQGTQSNARGEMYQGNFKKGERHGEGTMTWDGNVKTGTWYKGLFKGNQ